jgi:hypothetical protein
MDITPNSVNGIVMIDPESPETISQKRRPAGSTERVNGWETTKQTTTSVNGNGMIDGFGLPTPPPHGGTEKSMA